MSGYYNEKTIIYFNGQFIKAVDAKTDLYKFFYSTYMDSI